MVLVNFWRYPDPYQRFLIRIRIRPNDTDPTGSGSETLLNVIPFRNIMRKIAGVELWGNVAWSGQRGKVGLEKLKNVVNIIYGIFF